jgi:hypothetical protein
MKALTNTYTTQPISRAQRRFSFIKIHANCAIIWLQSHSDRCPLITNLPSHSLHSIPSFLTLFLPSMLFMYFSYKIHSFLFIYCTTLSVSFISFTNTTLCICSSFAFFSMHVAHLRWRWRCHGFQP